MSVWFRRLILILTIGGGFVGIVAVTIRIFAHSNHFTTYVVLLVVGALYGYGILIGLKLSERAVPLRHLRVYFSLQIPVVSSPLVVYQFCSGLQATVVILPGLGWQWRLGSEWHVAILSRASWGCGVNFVAAIIVLLLYSRWAHNSASPDRRAAGRHMIRSATTLD
jgi:hypothetical protein